MYMKQIHFIFSISIYFPGVYRSIKVDGNRLKLRESELRSIYLLFSNLKNGAYFDHHFLGPMPYNTPETNWVPALQFSEPNRECSWEAFIRYWHAVAP
jgi:hypothetical protein